MVNKVYKLVKRKSIQKHIYPDAVRPWARGIGVAGIGITVGACAFVVAQLGLGCGLLEGCEGGLDIRWSARIAIPGLLLAYIGFLDA